MEDDMELGLHVYLQVQEGLLSTVVSLLAIDELQLSQTRS